MDLMQTLLIAALIPIVTFITQGLMNAYRQRRRYGQLKRDSRFRIGAILTRLESEGRDKPVLMECQLTQARPGYYEFRSLSTPPEWISFTGQEVEKLFLIYKG